MVLRHQGGGIMAIEIYPLTAERIEDYFYYFDHVAFTDHAEWSRCYCTFYYFNSVTEIQLDGASKNDMKQHARRLIESGKLTGYLAYEGNAVVGWCNAGPRGGYDRLMEGTEICSDAEKSLPIKSIVCFSIAPNDRGRGIATALLNHVCAEAASQGYDAVEAYPKWGEGNNFEQYHGPIHMYERAGFRMIGEAGPYHVVRKAIK
jgi:GNAT superfamily N-acetyltransferase